VNLDHGLGLPVFGSVVAGVSLLLSAPGLEHVSDPSVAAALVAMVAALGGAYFKSKSDRGKRAADAGDELRKDQQAALREERALHAAERAEWKLERDVLLRRTHDCERDLQDARAKLLEKMAENVALKRTADAIDERKNHGRR
jgi:hypothetical protein